MQNKNYLVVGGTSGIGLEMVKQLVEVGAKVFVLSRTNKNLENFSNVEHIEGDVTQDDLNVEGLPIVWKGLLIVQEVSISNLFVRSRLPSFKMT